VACDGQIDYALDAQWIAWSQEAMRRILVNSEKPKTKNNQLVDNQRLLGPGITPGTRRDLWLPMESPLRLSTKTVEVQNQTDCGLQTLYGACTQKMDLEDDLFDLSMVSRPASPAHMDCFTLTRMLIVPVV
jgi:hypothetical protein